MGSQCLSNSARLVVNKSLPEWQDMAQLGICRPFSGNQSSVTAVRIERTRNIVAQRYDRTLGIELLSITPIRLFSRYYAPIDLAPWCVAEIIGRINESHGHCQKQATIAQKIANDTNQQTAPEELRI